jgi:hypothetical protein
MSAPAPAIKKQRLAPNSMEARGWCPKWAIHQSLLTDAHDGTRKYTVSKLGDGGYGITIRGGPAKPIPICEMDAELLKEFVADFHGSYDQLTDIQTLKHEDLVPLLKAIEERINEVNPPVGDGVAAHWLRQVRVKAAFEREGGVDQKLFNTYTHLYDAERQLIRMCGPEGRVYKDKEVMAHQADMAAAYGVLARLLGERAIDLNIANSKGERISLAKSSPLPTLLGDEGMLS